MAARRGCSHRPARGSFTPPPAEPARNGREQQVAEGLAGSEGQRKIAVDGSPGARDNPGLTHNLNLV